MTKPAGPLPITIEDLDRDELLELFRRRMMVRPSLSDLWGARWDALSRKALTARERELEAFTAYVAACGPLPKGLSPRALDGWLKDRDAKRLDRERADRAAKRVEAARDRAWAALEASWGRSAA